jgi:hypothetical protein
MKSKSGKPKTTSCYIVEKSSKHLSLDLDRYVKYTIHELPTKINVPMSIDVFQFQQQFSK